MRNKQRIAWSSAVAVLAVLLLLALLQLLFPDFYSWLGANTRSAGAPLYTIMAPIRSNASYEELQKRNAVLEAALERSAIDYSKLQQLQQENTELKQLTEYSIRDDVMLETGKIVGLAAVDQSNLVVINKGRIDGIEPGMPAVVEEGILFGVVSSVTRDHAFVIPIYSNAVTVSAKMQTQDGFVHGVVSGNPGLATQLELIPKDITFEIGEPIVTSGLDEQIPANLLIGYVSAVIDDPNSFFKSATIEYAVLEPKNSFVSVLLTDSFSQNDE